MNTMTKDHSKNRQALTDAQIAAGMARVDAVLTRPFTDAEVATFKRMTERSTFGKYGGRQPALSAMESVGEEAMENANRAIAALATTTALDGTDYSAPWREVIRIACQNSYLAGHTNAKAEAQLVSEAVDELQAARVDRLINAAVASTMLHTGNHQLVIDMSKVATVFDDYVLTAVPDPRLHGGQGVIYTLTAREEKGGV